MTTTIKVNAVDRSAGYTQNELDQVSLRFVAQDGEVGQGSAPIPDPAGTQTPYAGYSFQVIDGATTLLDGFVGPLMRERGESATGTRKLDTYSIGDENAVLHGFRAYRWSRPAESTRTRFLAFLAAYVPWVTDTTWVTSAVTATMPKKVYTTETLFDELMAEIKDLTGNVAFVENHRAHLHPPTAGVTGSLAFSDTSYDFSSAFPIYSPKRSKDPLDLRDDVMVTTPGGKATATDAPAIAIYDAGGLKHQALVQLSEGDAAAAATKAAAILADSKAERIMYEFDTGPLTAAQAASIPVGCLINLTSAVLGLTSSTQRIGAITLTYKHPGHWMAHIEAGFPVRTRRAAPRTTNPVDTANAQAQLQDCGSPITLSRWHRAVGAASGDTGWVNSTAIGAQQWGCELERNIAWPGTWCGIGVGAQDSHADYYSGWSFTAPADSNQIGAILGVTITPWGGGATSCPGYGHTPAGALCGSNKDRTDIVFYAGYTGGTPTVTDHQGGTQYAVSASGNVFLARSVFPFGAASRLVVGPGFHVTRDYACIEDILNGAGIGDGGGAIDITVQMRCLVDGTYGWIDAAPVERPDGSRTTFTLIGGYKTVDRLYLNGVIVPTDSYTATDGSTIALAGWAPKLTDLLIAHYYIPQ